MSANRLLVVDPCLEIFALQHLLQRHSAVEANYIFKRHASKPIAVANDFCSHRIENLKSLFVVSRRIRLYFIMRQLRSRNRPPARITNQSREIADDENCLVAEVLKFSQFSQNDGVPEVNIRGGWIDA